MLACGTADVLLLECCHHIVHIRTKQKDNLRSMLCLYKPQGPAFVYGRCCSVLACCVCRVRCCDTGGPYCGEKHCGLRQQHLWHLQHCCTEPCGIRTGQGELRGHMTYHVSCQWEPEEATGINLHNLPWLTCWTHQDHKGLGIQLNCASGPMHCCHSPLESSQSPRDSGHGLTGY